jgi:hypothetical protein
VAALLAVCACFTSCCAMLAESEAVRLAMSMGGSPAHPGRTIVACHG